MPITRAEIETIDAYNAIAESRRQALSNVEFWLPELQKLVGDNANPSLLDLGCGDGREAALYQSLYGNLTNYVGLDLSRGMLASARQRQLQTLALVESNMYRLPFAASTFQFIWASASLIHTPKSQITEPLSEIKRTLSADGKVFFAMREGRGESWEEGRTPSDRRYLVYWTEKEFCSALTINGFQVESPQVDTTRDARGLPWLLVFATKAC
ncbi:MAG: class I SAM-dependent methyltransferase [Microgenomates group bacterium]